jgi:hypothetical protein
VPATPIRLLLMLALLLLAGSRSAHAQPPTLDTYRQLVAEVYAAAQRADRIGLDERSEALLALNEVRAPNGTLLPVDNSWLRSVLLQEPPDYTTIAARLGAILDSLGQERSPIAEDAQAELDRIFAAPPFTSRELPSAWSRFWDAIGRAIARFFESLFGRLPAPAVNPGPAQSFSGLSPTGWILLVIGCLLLVALILDAIRGVRRSVVAEARAREEAEVEERLTTAEAVDRAAVDARAGDYRSAARHLYLSSLLWLEEHGLLRYDRSRTNREYLMQLRGKPVHDDLVPVVETFERVWYGHRPLDAASYDAYRQQVAQLRERQEPVR